MIRLLLGRVTSKVAPSEKTKTLGNLKSGYASLSPEIGVSPGNPG